MAAPPSPAAAQCDFLVEAPAARRSQALRASVVVAAGLVTVNGLAALRDMAVARRFGVAADIDGFFLALGLATPLGAILGGALQSSLVPAYLRVDREDGRSHARRLAGQVLGRYLVVATGIGAALTLAAPLLSRLLVGGSADPRAAATYNVLLLASGPVVVGGALALYFSALLNARCSFGPAAFAPAAAPLATVAAVLALGADPRVESLALAAGAGFVVSAVALGVLAWRRRLLARPVLHGGRAATGDVARQYLPAVASALVLAGNPVIDLLLAARLGVGSAAALTYASRIATGAAVVIAASVATPALTQFSRLAAAGDSAGLRSSVRRYAAGALAVSVPVAAVLVVASRQLVGALYEGGEFSAADATLVARVQALYALQVPAYVLGTTFARLISALRGNRFLLVIAAGALPVNVAADVVLGGLLGVSGIALATALVYVGTCAAAALCARHLLAGWPGSARAVPPGIRAA